jgi:acylphosphatase
MVESISIIVEGMVQGVYFRQSTKAKAIDLGITGEVMNNPDGTVHIIATGAPSELKELVEWCWKGPDTAIVKNVIVEKIPLAIFTGFTINRQAKF